MDSRSPATEHRSLSLKQMMLLILCAVVFGTIGVGFCIQRVGEATEEVAAAYEVRYASYLLADELRQSSDDLTRLARTYVVSGDGKWKDQYQEVLDIRAGKRERPAQYHKIYWDLRAADIRPSRGTEPALALVDLMKSAGFTEEEFAKLSEAERNSNDLVRTETLAMNMVGSQEGAKSPVPEAVNAQAMMHDASYHQFKAKIMQPVDEFFTAVDRRTQQAITAAQGKKAFWYATLICITAALLTVLVVALWAVYRQLSRSLEEAVRVSDAIAAGSLDVAVIASGPQEVASLLNKMSIMRDRLANVVSSVRQNAQAVASTCEQIAQGNGDLSARTQEQASSLEQTAASMEELSATVHRNADSATEADRLSHGASRIATRGGEAVGKVVDTMKEISESSGRISDIIGVIDDIAFQTNLLALNAAVEAARAGEQGRSFAVVAVEVRQLAQRSAEAARQIRELILNSVDRVKQGRAFVDQAGATMSELVEAIKQVTNVMGHIKTAGIEQSTGVSQISQAVAQMDGVTQQNAALVEESAAAAEMLAQQAQQLVAAVAAFKLESTSGHVTGERVDSHRVADAARTRTARAASGFEIAA